MASTWKSVVSTCWPTPILTFWLIIYAKAQIPAKSGMSLDGDSSIFTKTTPFESRFQPHLSHHSEGAVLVKNDTTRRAVFAKLLGMSEESLPGEIVMAKLEGTKEGIADDTQIIRYMKLETLLLLLAGQVFIPSHHLLRSLDQFEGELVLRSCWRRQNSVLAPAPAMAARSAAASMSARASPAGPSTLLRAGRPCSPDASDAFALVDRLIHEEQIDCSWEKPGRFVGAWTKAHFEGQSRRLALLNTAAQSDAYMVPRERQRDEIDSDYYHGGMVVERSGKLHPALYYKGLLEACRRRDVRGLRQGRGRAHRAESATGWRVDYEPRRGLGRRCRHRHQRLHRRA